MENKPEKRRENEQISSRFKTGLFSIIPLNRVKLTVKFVFSKGTTHAVLDCVTIEVYSYKGPIRNRQLAMESLSR